MTSALVNPEALILARDSRGRTQEQLADAAKVSQGLIVAVYAGSIAVSLSRSSVL